MTRTSRTSNAPLYAAIGVAVLALLIAATTTAFAAGLAANSVGTKQLQKNAVVASKIKNKSVGRGKLADGAVTEEKIADGVIPPGPSYIARPMAVSATPVSFGTINGLKLVGACGNLSRDYVDLNITRIGGGNVSFHGTISRFDNNGDSTLPQLQENEGELDLFGTPPLDDGTAIVRFDGWVQGATVGDLPVHIEATLRVDDNEPTPCQINLAVESSHGTLTFG